MSDSVSTCVNASTGAVPDFSTSLGATGNTRRRTGMATSPNTSRDVIKTSSADVAVAESASISVAVIAEVYTGREAGVNVSVNAMVRAHVSLSFH